MFWLRLKIYLFLQELDNREDVITDAEQHLQALGKELGERFRKLENSGEDVSQEKATLENTMAESAANVKAVTTPRKRNVTETVRRSRSRKVNYKDESNWGESDVEFLCT